MSFKEKLAMEIGTLALSVHEKNHHIDTQNALLVSISIGVSELVEASKMDDATIAKILGANPAFAQWYRHTVNATTTGEKPDREA